MASPALYSELIDLLAKTTDRERLVNFRLSTKQQHRLDALLEKNRTGELSLDETNELDEFERIEHVVRLVKARALQMPTP
jgi:hypothetical protein